MEVASFKASIDDFSESENIFIREEFKYCVSDLIETGSFLFRKFRDKFFDGTWGGVNFLVGNRPTFQILNASSNIRDVSFQIQRELIF